MASEMTDTKIPDVVHNEYVNPDAWDYASPELVVRGDILLDEERHYSTWKASKRHWRALLICTLSFTGGVVFGYDVIVNGGTLGMPAFLLAFGEVGPTGLYLSSVWTSLWTAMGQLMQTVGAFATGFVTDRFGRKWPGVAAGVITCVATAIQFTATSKGALLAGKMLAGFGLGIAMAIATSCSSEVAPANLRRQVQSALVLATVLFQGVALGMIRIFVPNIAESSFRTVFALQWVVGGAMIVAFALAPESPSYLILQNRLDKARKVMKKIYGPKNDPDARLACMIRTIQEEKTLNASNEGATYFECFKGTDRKRTLTIMFLFASPNIAGAALLAQSIYFLIVAGLPAIHAYDVGLGGFALAAVMIIISWFMTGWLKNRTGVYIGIGINFTFMLIIGCLYYTPAKGALWAIAVLMSVLTSVLVSFLQGMGWPIAAELSQLRLRAKSVSIGIMTQSFSAWITTFVMPYIYNVDAGNLGARTGFIFVAASILLFIGTWYLVPDTTGMNIEDLDHAYQQKIPAWRINVNSVAHRNIATEEKLES